MTKQEELLLEKFRELDRAARVALAEIHAAKSKSKEQTEALTTYLALDARIARIERRLGCDDLADARASGIASWLIYMGFEKKPEKFQQSTLMAS